MALGKLLRENIVLVIGVSMPIVVVVLFLAATYVPRLFVDPPQYDFLFAKSAYSPDSTRWRYEVDVDVERRLRIQAALNDSKRPSNSKRLFLYEHSSDNVREIRIPTPAPPATAEADEEAEVRVLVEIPELSDSIIDSRRVAPDGYEFAKPRRTGGALFGLFYRQHGAEITISRNGAVIEVNSGEDDNLYFYSDNITFLGWLLPPSEE